MISLFEEMNNNLSYIDSSLNRHMLELQHSCDYFSDYAPRLCDRQIIDGTSWSLRQTIGE